MDLNLTNKVFLIAGSSKGIGYGIAKCFLEEHAHVIITGRGEKQLANAKKELANFSNSEVLAVSGDMSEYSVIEETIKKSIDHFGRIDGVIANIGSGAEPLDYLTDPDIWQKSYDKNIKASLLLAQASILYLKRKGGTITFISSIAGVEDIKAPIAYSMHKAAIIAVSKKLASTLAEHNIRVNVVAPGNILFSGGGWDQKIQKAEQEVKQYIQNEVPLKCFGTPDDIGYMCTFLVSDKAKFITGSLMVVDGGQTRSY